jgi:plastocyanin
VKKLLSLAFAAALLALFAVPALARTRGAGVKDDFYTPHSISIAKNSTVRWHWLGSGRHNVVLARGPGAGFRSSIKRHGFFSHKFTRRGTYKIVCTVHSDMRMTVHVT